MLKYIIIFCLIIVIVIINNKAKEDYDARVSDVNNIGKCANMCSSVYGCAGFAQNNTNGKCYLSKFPITSPPIPALYSGEYKEDNIYCNKLFPINTDYSLNNDMYVDNRVYNCYTKKAEELGQRYYDENGGEKTIQLNDIYSIKTNPYDLQYLEWPNTDNKKDIKFDSNLNIVYDEKDIVYQGDSDNEYKGDYLYFDKCKTNIKLDKCLKECTNNSKCIGVEYNPQFKDYKNVCCLKSSIKEKVKRRNKADNGTFYIKQIVSPYSSTKNNIII